MQDLVICGAKTRKGGSCHTRAVMANGRCRMHGGATPSGVGLPQTQHGRYSRQLPTRLAGRYEEARSDPDLLGLRDDVALLDTRMATVVAALDTGESREAWAMLGSAWATFEEQFQTLMDTGEPPEEMEDTVALISKLVKDGASQGYVWQEIRGLLKERAALVANERQRVVQLQQMITAEQALVMLGSIVDTIKRHVRDRDVLAAISSELGKLALQPAR